MNTNILILCDTSIYHAVIVSTQDQKDAYIANGFTLYGGPVDEQGLPTDSQWCRTQLGLPPIKGPTGCEVNDAECERQGSVLPPTGCYLAEQTPLDQCFEKNTQQIAGSSPTELPRTGSDISIILPIFCTIAALSIYKIIKGLLR